MCEKVFLNNQLVDADQAAVSVRDSGLLYGAGLFETMRSYNSVVFALDEHLDRLFRSAETLSINCTYEKQFMYDAVYKTLTANNLSSARLRLTLTAGAITDDGQQPDSTLLIAAAKLKSYPAEYYQKGILVVISPFRQNPTDPTHGHKTLNYYPRMLALNKARQKLATEALWFTLDNRLAEGCISNVFLAKDSKLYTPKLQTPVLNPYAP